MNNYDNILKDLYDFGVEEQAPNEFYIEGQQMQRMYNNKYYLCKIYKSAFYTAINDMLLSEVRTRVNNNNDVMDYLKSKLDEMFKSRIILETSKIDINIIYSIFVKLYDETKTKVLVEAEKKALDETPKKRAAKKPKLSKEEQIKPKKKNITQLMKRRVWAKHIGEEIGKSKCLCCNMSDITQLTFNCGHIIAEANGGELTVDNLLPICQSCNSSMGTQNLHDYKQAHGL